MPSKQGAWAEVDYQPRTADLERVGRGRGLTHKAVLVDTSICSNHDRISDCRGRILDKILVGGGGGCSIWNATGDQDEAEDPRRRLGVDEGEPWGRSGRWRIALNDEQRAEWACGGRDAVAESVSVWRLWGWWVVEDS
jgi:hypothetical protein